MSDDRPNILWYCTDQQRFDTIAALGNPHVSTAALDRLAAQGTAFTHAYCQSPICTPSRSSFMTGLYPSRLHNCRNGNESFPQRYPLISKLLADAGYDCGMVGKFHLQSAGFRNEPRLDDGFCSWKFSHAPRDDWAEGHDYADWVREQGGDLDALRQCEERVPPELHQTAWATDRGIEFIDQPRGKPWMLAINVYDPHPPFVPPKIYADRFNPESLPGPHFRESDLAAQQKLQAVDFQTTALRPQEFDGRRQQALYYAMIAQIDDQFARLLNHLEQIGQANDTVVIFSSDHGETLGDHGLQFKGCRFYEGLVRVPLLFSWPEKISADVQSDALVELLDLSATLLDLGGVTIPEYFQGRSLLPILCGEKSADHHRDYVRCEYYDALAAAFVGTGSPDVPAVSTAGESESAQSPRRFEQDGCLPFTQPSGSYATMYRDRRFKIVVYHGHDCGELFDLEQDPWEFENLWDSAEHQSVKTALLLRNFDAAILTGIDVGSRRIAPM